MDIKPPDDCTSQLSNSQKQIAGSILYWWYHCVKKFEVHLEPKNFAIISTQIMCSNRPSRATLEHHSYKNVSFFRHAGCKLVAFCPRGWGKGGGYAPRPLRPGPTSTNNFSSSDRTAGVAAYTWTGSIVPRARSYEQWWRPLTRAPPSPAPRWHQPAAARCAGCGHQCDSPARLYTRRAPGAPRLRKAYVYCSSAYYPLFGGRGYETDRTAGPVVHD